jgi:DNA-binding NtrC family response regulator
LPLSWCEPEFDKEDNVTFTRYGWSLNSGEDAGRPPAIPDAEPSGVSAISLDDKLRDVERTLISWALRVTRGNKSKAAALLQIKRSTLGDRINRCGLGRAPVASDQTRLESVGAAR